MAIITDTFKDDTYWVWALDRCLNCGWKKGGESKRENVPFEKSLEYNFPEVSKTWHPIKNGDLAPDKVFANSGLVYWWLCPDCGSDYDMAPHNRAGKGQNCPYCRGARVNHTNCMSTVAPEIAKLLWNPEDGYKYTHKSNQRTDFKCPDCIFRIKNKIIQNISVHGLFCPYCSDGVSYPEKFFFNFLYQLDVEFEYQKTFNWSKEVGNKNDSLDGYKRYDFYIPSINCIVEIHGLQHYFDSFKGMNTRRSLEEEQENDKIKEFITRNNGIDAYIVIDCAKSELEFIKTNIINSELSRLFNLDNVDWLKCHEYSCNSLVKTVCQLFNEGNKTAKEISIIMKMSPDTMRKYLRQGNKLGWCNFESSKEKTGIPIIRLSLDGTYIDEFRSAKEASERLSMFSTSISAVCGGKQKTSGGFKWMYKSEYDKQMQSK